MSSRNSLPSLPFELQLEILTQVPIRYIFSLRRVSRAWCSMLSNPHLESAIMKLYPFLTTAPTLAALTKRRLRMLRNEPVSVTCRSYGIDDVEATDRYLVLQRQFHMGCQVCIVDGPPRPDNAAYVEPLVLKVVDHRQGARVVLAVDLNEVAKVEFAAAWGEYGVPREGEKRCWRPFQLHMHGSFVLVGFQAQRFREPGLFWSELPGGWLTDGLYFLLFNRYTGDLVQRWVFGKTQLIHETVCFSDMNDSLLCLGWGPMHRQLPQFSSLYVGQTSEEDLSTRDAVIATYSITTGEELSTVSLPGAGAFFELGLAQALTLDSLGNMYFPLSRPVVNHATVMRCISATTGKPHPTADHLLLPPVPIPIPESVAPMTYSFFNTLAIGCLPQDPSICYAFQLFATEEHEPFGKFLRSTKSSGFPVLIRTIWRASDPLSTQRSRIIELPEEELWGSDPFVIRPMREAVVPEYQIVETWGVVRWKLLMTETNPDLEGTPWRLIDPLEEEVLSRKEKTVEGSSAGLISLAEVSRDLPMTGPVPSRWLIFWSEGDDGVWFCDMLTPRDELTELLPGWGNCVTVCWDEEYTFQ